MVLNFRRYGNEGPPLIILHGLYGSSDNWVTIARQLADEFQVIVPDQRNHGSSPHCETHTYEAMSEDLNELMIALGIDKVCLMGHSMGGKTAMTFALKYPNKVDKLVVIDIAPKSYYDESDKSASIHNHLWILEALAKTPVKAFQSREEIDRHLSNSIADSALRQFLLKNIKREEDGTFGWKLNLSVLIHSLPEILDGFSKARQLKNPFSGPAYFIRGSKSSYVLEEDMLMTRRLFTRSELVTLPDAGHWVHAEQPELLMKTIRYFLED